MRPGGTFGGRGGDEVSDDEGAVGADPLGATHEVVGPSGVLTAPA